MQSTAALFLQSLLSKLITNRALLSKSIQSSYSIKNIIRRKIKMQNLKSKTLAILIALILTVSIGASMSIIPGASAHSPPWTITDHAYIALSPNPIGVGQTEIITFWTAQPLPNAALTNNIRKENYTLTITLPDRTTTSQFFSVVANPGGVQTVTYVPSETGNYTFAFSFGGMTYPTLAQVTSTITLTAAIQASINAFAGDTYTPETATTSLTVQQQPIQNTVYPLPSAYWTRPIEGENIYWYTVASNWLGPSSAQLGTYQQSGYNNFQNSGTAPNSAHILWTVPIEMGGVVGGSNTGVPGASFYSGSSYEPRFYNAIIMDGYLYFKMPLSDEGSPLVVNGVTYAGAYVCLDLRTGKVVWSNSNAIFNPTWGQLYNEVDPNQSGVIPSGYLWQSFTVAAAVTNAAGSTVTPANVTWIAYDGFTGDWVMNITNVPQAVTVYQPSSNSVLSGSMLSEQTTLAAMGNSGELLIYVLDYNTATQTGWLGLWNTTQIIYNPASPSSPYRPLGQIFNGALSTSYTWNVTINGDLNGLAVNGTAANGVSLTGPSMFAVFPGDLIFGASGALSASQFTQNPFTMWTINLNSTIGTVGNILWVQNYTAPNIMNGNSNLGSYTIKFGPVDPTNGVITLNVGETMEWYGYSLATGTLLWGPTTTPFPDGFQYFGSGRGVNQYCTAAYGNIYVQGFGGEIWAYDTANGNLIWQYGNGGEGNSTNDGINSPWGLLPTMITAVCDGMVYGYTTQHGNGAQSPYYVNEFFFCLNATTGQQIWTLLGMGTNDGGAGNPAAIIADGELVFQNMYDNQIYAVGQGPSATTVQAPLTAITTGDKVTLQGTVMDISAGTQQGEQTADFPNGVPCASDASQTQWMEYVYMQKPEPTNFTGVTVTLTAIDPNGNYINLGTATTDSNGLYSYSWQTPNIPGMYTITATFSGTNSYWGSNAQTAVTVTNAASATAAPTATPTSAADLYFVPAIAGILVVIIVGFVVLALLMLRKRP